MQSPLVVAPLSQNHLLERIDNMYLTNVYSTDLVTTIAFLIHIYIPKATPGDIASSITMQIDEMQKAGILNPADSFACTMTAHPLVGIRHTTYLDDERISHTTTMISNHLEGTPHAFIVTTPTFSQATYGLTLPACKQLRWTTNIPNEYINVKLPGNLRKLLLAQVPTITCKNVDKSNTSKDSCTIHCHEFQGLLAIASFNLFRAATI
jgi:hypothetical protein